MDSLWEEFDDLELECDREPQPSNDKGKRPVDDDYSTDDESNNADSSHHPHRAPHSPAKSSEPGDMTCAICLGEIALPEMAMVKGCAHIYCAKCIVAWALHRENPACPQCKQTFSYLLTYRTLDGELQDFPTEESVVLLKRARWLEKDLKACLDDTDGSFLDDARHADDFAWHDYADEYDLDEDEAIEQFYFSSAAGRARVMIGNRRFGEGGFVSGGRRCARPAAKSKKANKGGGKAAAGGGGASTSKATAASERLGDSGNGNGAGSSRSIDIQTPNAYGGRKGSVGAALASTAAANGVVGGSFGAHMSSTPSGSSFPRIDGSSFLPGDSSPIILGSSPAGSGRRARRNARRAAFDASVAGSSSNSGVDGGASGSMNATVATEVEAVGAS